MKEGIEEIVLRLEAISQDSRIIELKVIEKTKSILKARLYFLEDVFVQIYVNNRGHKSSFTLIINDSRIFGKDYIFGAWHSHHFEAPHEHDVSEKSRKPVSLEDFVEEATFILSEKLKII